MSNNIENSREYAAVLSICANAQRQIIDGLDRRVVKLAREEVLADKGVKTAIAEDRGKYTPMGEAVVTNYLDVVVNGAVMCSLVKRGLPFQVIRDKARSVLASGDFIMDELDTTREIGIPEEDRARVINESETRLKRMLGSVYFGNLQGQRNDALRKEGGLSLRAYELDMEMACISWMPGEYLAGV